MEKVKNLPFMRLAAFAVAVAIILGLSSAMLSFTANAAAVDNVNALNLSAHQLGTLGSYPVIGIPTSGLLADYISTSDESGSMSMRDYFLPFVVFNGDIYYYNRLVYIGYHKSYFDKFPNCALAFYGQCNFSPIYDSLKSGNTSPSKKFDYRYFSFSESGNTLTVTNSEYPSNTWTVTYEFKSASGVTLSSSNVNRILFARVKTCLSTDDTVDVSDLSPYINSSDTYKDIDTGNEPSAEFTNFKGTDEAEPYLFFVDWFDTGNRLPLADFRIDDNANYHSYSLRISTNKQYVETLKSVWAEQEVKEAIALSQSLIGNVCIPLNHSQLIKRVAQLVIIKKVGTFSYNVERNITSDLMRFDDSSNVNSKGISICLSDYVTIIPYCIYKLEIIDNNTSSILDTVYFNSENGYSKGNSGYGTKVNDYENKSDLDDDLKNNNGFTGGTPSNGDVMNIDDPADITDMDNIKAYGDLDITSIFNSLQSSSRALASFFQMCMNIIPAGILAIILGGLSIVIILRILGR